MINNFKIRARNEAGGLRGFQSEYHKNILKLTPNKIEYQLRKTVIFKYAQIMKNVEKEDSVMWISASMLVLLSFAPLD